MNSTRDRALLGGLRAEKRARWRLGNVKRVYSPQFSLETVDWSAEANSMQGVMLLRVR